MLLVMQYCILTSPRLFYILFCGLELAYLFWYISQICCIDWNLKFKSSYFCLNFPVPVAVCWNNSKEEHMYSKRDQVVFTSLVLIEPTKLIALFLLIFFISNSSILRLVLIWRDISEFLSGLTEEFNIDKFLGVLLDSLLEYRLEI